MARKLKGFPGDESGAATVAEETPMPVEAKDKKYIPFTGTEDLPKPVIKEKVRVKTLADGTEIGQKDIRYIKSGDPRYSVSLDGELIAHFLKRGGVARRFVYKFKSKFPDTKEGREKRRKNDDFRARLRAAGIPGA